MDQGPVLWIQGRRNINEPSGSPIPDRKIRHNVSRSSSHSSTGHHSDDDHSDEDYVNNTTQEQSNDEDTTSESNPIQLTLLKKRAKFLKIPECNLLPDTRTDNTQSKGIGIWLYALAAFVVIIAGLACLLAKKNFSLANSFSSPSCNTALPPAITAADEMQDNFATAVREIQRFKKPSVVTVIYNNRSEEEVDQHVGEYIKYAACALNGGYNYIEVSSADVTAPEVRADRGKLITKYKQRLEDEQVMLVKHLERVPGEVAIVFHHLCDEHSPVVKRALIVFTLQYSGDMGGMSEYAIVDNVLHARWNKRLKEDALPPLITRLTSAIVKI